jgi:DNA repair exonuclease SbcCD ATPase subunit
VNFSDGMHVIHEPNGWGKSTLAAFIKVMFFGFDTKREAGTFEKERNLYRPWQGGAYGGELEFEAGGRLYRISRTFGKTEKADEFHLYDCVTNLECDDYSWNIGEELFDLDAASFKRSIFISQNDCASQATDAINAKLGNLVENTNDINNYESAQEYLKNLANQLSPNRVTGSLKKRRNQMASLEQELLSYEAAEQGALELKQKQDFAIANKEHLMKQRDTYAGLLREASEESRKKELQKNYLNLCEEQQEKLSALLPYKEIFPAGMPDEALLAEQIANARKLEEDRNTLLHMELTEDEQTALQRQLAMFAGGVPEDEEIDGQLARLKEIQGIRDDRMRIEVLLSEKEHESLRQSAPAGYQPPKFAVSTILGILFLLAGLAGEVLGILSINTASYGLALVIGSALVFFLGNIILISGVRKRAGKLEAAELARKEWEESQRLLSEEVTRLQEEEADKNSLIRQIYGEAEEFLSQYRADEAEAPDTDAFEPQEMEVSPEQLPNDTEEILDLNREDEAEEEAVSNTEVPEPQEEEVSPEQIPEAKKDEHDYADSLRELKLQAHEYLRLREKTIRYEAFQAAVQKKQGALLTYGRSIGQTLGADITAELTAVATEVVKYRMAKENADAAQARVREFEAANDTEELLRENELEFGIEEINAHISELDDEIEEARGGIEQYARQLEDLEEQLDQRDEKEQELTNLTELSRQEQKLYDTVTATQDFLQRAREQFTARYMAPISNAFRKYYHLLVGTEEEQNWQIDANINFRLKEQGELRETKWLSTGYQDLIGICMRLAMVDAMYQGEKPFLILDDPFVNLDEEKTKRGMHLLMAVAQEYQILYFTCHSSREP